MPNLTKDLTNNLKNTLQQIININQALINNTQIFNITPANKKFINLLQKQILKILEEITESKLNWFNQESSEIKDLINQIYNLLQNNHFISQNNNKILQNNINKLIKSIKLLQNNFSHLMNAGVRLNLNNANLTSLFNAFEQLLTACNYIKTKNTNTPNTPKKFRTLKEFEKSTAKTKTAKTTNSHIKQPGRRNFS